MITKKMVEVSKSGQMAHVMMAFGRMAWPMDMADSFMQKVMFMKVNGRKTRPTVMESIHISTVADMRDNGTRISSMGIESNNGLTVPSTKVNTSKE